MGKKNRAAVKELNDKIDEVALALDSLIKYFVNQEKIKQESMEQMKKIALNEGSKATR